MYIPPVIAVDERKRTLMT